MDEPILLQFGNDLRALMSHMGWEHKFDSPTEDIVPSYDLRATLPDQTTEDTASSALQSMIQELAVKHGLIIKKCDMTSGYCYLGALEPDPTHLLWVMSITIMDDVRVAIADHSTRKKTK